MQIKELIQAQIWRRGRYCHRPGTHSSPGDRDCPRPGTHLSIVGEVDTLLDQVPIHRLEEGCLDQVSIPHLGVEIVLGQVPTHLL